MLTTRPRRWYHEHIWNIKWTNSGFEPRSLVRDTAADGVEAELMTRDESHLLHQNKEQWMLRKINFSTITSWHGTINCERINQSCKKCGSTGRESGTALPRSADSPWPTFWVRKAWEIVVEQSGGVVRLYVILLPRSGLEPWAILYYKTRSSLPIACVTSVQTRLLSLTSNFIIAVF